MRKMFLKNRLSSNKKRKELIMSEHLEGDGVIQDYEKRVIYTVKNVFSYSSKQQLEEILNNKVEKIAGPQTFIIKNRDTKRRSERIIHKVIGLQCMVFNEKIVVLHLLQITRKNIRILPKKVVPSP